MLVFTATTFAWDRQPLTSSFRPPPTFLPFAIEPPQVTLKAHLHGVALRWEVTPEHGLAILFQCLPHDVTVGKRVLSAEILRQPLALGFSDRNNGVQGLQLLYRQAIFNAVLQGRLCFLKLSGIFTHSCRTEDQINRLIRLVICPDRPRRVLSCKHRGDRLPEVFTPRPHQWWLQTITCIPLSRLMKSGRVRHFSRAHGGSASGRVSEFLTYSVNYLDCRGGWSC